FSLHGGADFAGARRTKKVVQQERNPEKYEDNARPDDLRGVIRRGDDGKRGDEKQPAQNYVEKHASMGFANRDGLNVAKEKALVVFGEIGGFDLEKVVLAEPEA